MRTGTPRAAANALASASVAGASGLATPTQPPATSSEVSASRETGAERRTAGFLSGGYSLSFLFFQYFVPETSALAIRPASFIL